MRINTKEIIERGFMKDNEAEELMNNEKVVKFDLIDRDNSIESIWGILLNETEEGAHVVLANHAIAMMPARSWGLVIETKKGPHDRLLAKIEDEEDRISKCYPQYVEHWKHMFEGEDGE